MSADDELSEEQIRAMERNLLAVKPVKGIQVETRSKYGPRKRAVPKTILRVVECRDGYTGEGYEWIFEEKQGESWIEFERFDDRSKAFFARRKYGAMVEQWHRTDPS